MGWPSGRVPAEMLPPSPPQIPLLLFPDQPHTVLRDSISPAATSPSQRLESSNPPWKTAPAELLLSQTRLFPAICGCFPACSRVKGPLASLIFGAAKQKSKGQNLHGHKACASSLILVVDGSCWAQHSRGLPSFHRTLFPGPFPPHQAVSSSKGSRGGSPALVPPRGAQ